MKSLLLKCPHPQFYSSKATERNPPNHHELRQKKNNWNSLLHLFQTTGCLRINLQLKLRADIETTLRWHQGFAEVRKIVATKKTINCWNFGNFSSEYIKNAASFSFLLFIYLYWMSKKSSPDCISTQKSVIKCQNMSICNQNWPVFQN